MNFVNADVVKDLLLELDLDMTMGDKHEFCNTALVLLSAPVCGPETTRLAAFTGLPCSFIAPIRRRMIQAELWTNTEVRCDEWYMASGVLCPRCFWLDVLVAEGLVMRTWDEEEGQYCYGYNLAYSERVN